MIYSELGVLTKALNEIDYQEFIAHHLTLGFDRITVYDNESPFDLKKLTEPFDKNNVVKFIGVKGWPNQLGIYTNHSINADSRWLGFIEDDEFLMIDNISDNINDLLENYEPYAGLAINMIWIGYNGNEAVLETRPERSITKSSLYRVPLDQSVQSHTRTFANPQKVRHWPTPHLPSFNSTQNVAVRWDGLQINRPVDDPADHKIAIYHYFTKALSDWEQKVSRKRADIQNVPQEFNLFYDYYNEQTEYDPTVKDFREKTWGKSVDLGKID